LNRQFSKEGIQMANKYMKKCSAFLAVKEKQIKTILRFHLNPVRVAITQQTNNIKCWLGCRSWRRGVGKFIHCWWECKLARHYGNHYGGSTKNYFLRTAI
jgi:hypothetical protein